METDGKEQSGFLPRFALFLTSAGLGEERSCPTVCDSLAGSSFLICIEVDYLCFASRFVIFSVVERTFSTETS